jgi:hypothetical protein
MNKKVIKYLKERVEVSINKRIKDPRAAERATARKALSLKQKEEKKQLVAKYIQFKDQYRDQKQSLIGKQRQEREELRKK